MRRIWTERAILLAAIITMSGCAAHRTPVLPHADQTMLDIWNSQSARPADRSLLEARQTLRRPLTDAESALWQHAVAAYTRDASNEIHRQFHRLPNPDLVMYVFPHLSGSEQAPVPGYSTVFPFYQHVQYALPGESGGNE